MEHGRVTEYLDEDDEDVEDDVEDDDEDVELVTASSSDRANRAEQLPLEDDRPPVGSWWWVNSKRDNDGYKPSDYDEPGKKWLACVIEVGSNYVKVQGVRFRSRIALDNFYTRCSPENDPDAYIMGKVGFYKKCVRELMAEIQQVCHLLGIPLRQALAESKSDGQASQALAVVHGVDDVKKYGNALVKAKEKTLPELFKKVKEQHEHMATWMKADLIPAKAELSAVEDVIEVIENKIHTVELYGGLQEELVQVREGNPAAIDAKVHLMQRRHYMDEECLVRYEAGGMDFKSVGAFDKWLARPENFARILPHDRTIVAFRIRRHDKQYGSGKDTLANFIRFWEYNEANKHTFLYIRNGQQLWRMETSIEFDEQLFSSKEESDLLGNSELWIKESEHELKSNRDSFGSPLITDRKRNALIDQYKNHRRYYARALWQWHNAGKPEEHWLYTAGDNEPRYGWKAGEQHAQRGKPYRWGDERRCEADNYVRLTPDNIYFDDAMKRIQRAAFKHNRVAVIIQGLLDRSLCLHPHAPWRIWTPEGFAAGIELVYDASRAIAPGEAPSFETYREQLNKSLRVGSTTVGQRKAWSAAMEEKYGEKRHWNAAGKGPKHLDVVQKLWRDNSCDFSFSRERMRPKWVPAERPGYIKASYPEIAMTWRCPAAALMCVDAYTPGDFHLFYDDPRTRADYLKWAPYLLAAEDWHHKQKQTPKKSKKSNGSTQTERTTEEKDDDDE